MLVLSRKSNQTIIIDNQIVITIVRINGDSVRIGIDAPKDISVNRGEIQERINQEGQTNGS